MKSFLFLVILFITINASKAQLLGGNMVMNGDFESYNDCPQFLGELYKATGWFCGTWQYPDYYNSCSQYISGVNDNVGVPLNDAGFQDAHSGYGYAGGGLWVYDGRRDYITGTLIDTLKPNKLYQFDCYISIAEMSSVFANNLGVYLSDTNPQFFPWYTSLDTLYTPQMTWDSSEADFSDTTNWIHLSGYYQAHGGESFIMLGNFRNNENSDTTINVNHFSAYPSCYFYLDDVSLREIIPESASFPDANNGCVFYPIPADAYLVFDCTGLQNLSEISNIAVMNVLGQKVFEMTNPQELYLNTEDLDDGIYFLNVVKKGGNLIHQSFIVAHKQF